MVAFSAALTWLQDYIKLVFPLAMENPSTMHWVGLKTPVMIVPKTQGHTSQLQADYRKWICGEEQEAN